MRDVVLLGRGAVQQGGDLLGDGVLPVEDEREGSLTAARFSPRDTEDMEGLR
jgi:hypothetical protein